MANIDFAGIQQTTVLKQNGKRRKCNEDEPREFLRVWETAPARALNAVGPSAMPGLSDEQVWDEQIKPQAGGAVFGTELASSKDERRGIGLNRWMKAVVDYIEFETVPLRKSINEYMLSEEVCTGFYLEANRILPSLKYCLAPKKNKAAPANVLRCGNPTQTGSMEAEKNPAELERHAKLLYAWLNMSTLSHVRRMLKYHSASGTSWVGECHHRLAQCFRYRGNSHLTEYTGNEVSEAEFLNAIKTRLKDGCESIPPSQNEANNSDFGQLTRGN